ncbi:hypothetical protein [Leucobacter sp. GX24907]
MRTPALVIPAVLALAYALTSCASQAQPLNQGPATDAPGAKVEVSAACNEAFDEASEAINHLYANHPFYGPEYDALYADGEITEEEQATLDAMQADENAQFEAAIAPTYEACNGIEEFYTAAYERRDDSDWSLKDSEHITTEENKAYFLSSYCHGREAKPACADFVAEEWN